MNCDQVFDRLTRGPFPGGGADDGGAEDAGVERHLQFCHDCRQLAEALRPAVSLLHEALIDQADELPSYSGALPQTESDVAVAIMLRPQAQPVAASTDSRRATSRSSVAWLAAAIGLSIVLAGAVWGMMAAGLSHDANATFNSTAHQTARKAPAIPDEKGRALLVSLDLSPGCLVQELPAATNDAARYHCCTECHSRSSRKPSPLIAMATLTRSCQACHR